MPRSFHPINLNADAMGVGELDGVAVRLGVAVRVGVAVLGTLVGVAVLAARVGVAVGGVLEFV